MRPNNWSIKQLHANCALTYLQIKSQTIQHGGGRSFLCILIRNVNVHYKIKQTKPPTGIHEEINGEYRAPQEPKGGTTAGQEDSWENARGPTGVHGRPIIGRPGRRERPKSIPAGK